jgi:hypothetical protein
VWCWVFNTQSHNQYMLPYSAQSPISKKVKDFTTVNDIWNEIEKIAKSDHKYSIGQQLYYLLPLFANPFYIIQDKFYQLINEYYYITDYNIPLGRTLDETDAHKLSMFNIIKNEMALALKHKAEKNGESKS